MQIELLTVAALAIAVIAVVAAVIMAVRAGHLRHDLARTRSELDSERATGGEALENLATAFSDRTEARTQLTLAEAQLAALRTERDAARDLQAEAENARVEAEKNAALARQAREATELRLKDWEATKAEFHAQSKAAMLEITHEVSSKLIADTKRENDAARKATEERIKKSTKDLGDHFEGVARTVTALDRQVAESRKTLDTVWQALSSPGGAGHYSQIGLENTLKSFGLERGRDFVTEHTIEDLSESRRFRPDAVVFLPFESVLVIDSKASKFLLEIAELEGTDEEEAAYENLSRSMNQHLKDLAGKDYQGAILEDYRSAGRSDEIRRVLSVMYLPNETAIERLKKADPDFDAKAAKAKIILAGPSGLSSIIGFACAEIDLGRQTDNQEKIIESTQRLLESLATVVGHVDKLGNGLKTATKNFGKLTGSINRHLIPRAQGLNELGVRPTKNRSMPNRLAQYEVIEVAQPAVIDGDSEDVSDNVRDILIQHTDAAE